MEPLALTLMGARVTLAGLGALVLICLGLYLAAKMIRMPPHRPGVEGDWNVEAHPDGMGGSVAVVLCAAFLACLIIVSVYRIYASSPRSHQFSILDSRRSSMDALRSRSAPTSLN